MLDGNAGPGGSGAAVLVDSAGPVISNCIFTRGVVRSSKNTIRQHRIQ